MLAEQIFSINLLSSIYLDCYRKSFPHPQVSHEAFRSKIILWKQSKIIMVHITQCVVKVVEDVCKVKYHKSKMKIC